MTTTKRVPIADGLFTWPSDEPRLIGGRCPRCRTVTFPRSPGCPKCSWPDPDEVLLERRGQLWTWTTQGYRPKEPYLDPDPDGDFEPYLLGYIELGGEVRVEGRLTGVHPGEVEIGMEMEVVVVGFRTDEEGNEVVTYAFAPTDGPEA